MSISAVVLTKNEEKNLQRCLESLQWCDEIIVVDDDSDDQTASLARRKGATVYKHALENDFSKQRNFGLEKATHEWVLFVDVDEVVSSSLQKEILRVVRSSHARQGYLLHRKDVMWGGLLNYGEPGSQWLMRLCKKTAGVWVGAVHEQWKITGSVGDLRGILYHYPHQTVEEFIREINFYTDIRAGELFEAKQRVSIWEILLYPKAKFFQNYLLKLGFLDGVAGLVTAIIMSFHSFLVRAKLWLLWHKENE